MSAIPQPVNYYERHEVGWGDSVISCFILASADLSVHPEQDIDR